MCCLCGQFVVEYPLGGREHNGRITQGGQPMAPRVRTVAYVRVSTDKQVEHGLSLDAQQAKLMAYAAL